MSVRQCFVLQRKHTRTLYSISNESGGRNVLAFKCNVDAYMFLGMMNNYNRAVEPNPHPSLDPKPVQPIVVQNFAVEILEASCAGCGLGISLIDQVYGNDSQSIHQST